MIEGVIALGVILAGPPLMLPWAALVVPHDSRGAWPLRLGLTLAFSAGAVWAMMLGLGLLSLPMDARLITIAVGLIGLAGAVAARGRVVWQRPTLPQSASERIVVGLVVVLCMAILFNGLYFPLYRDDAINIYGPQAAEIARTQALIPLPGEDTLYRAYPMLVQFNMALAYDLAGWQNDSLAKVIPTLLSLGCLIAVYSVSAQVQSSRAAWLSVLALALIPSFSRWASAAYVDLPMGFLYTLGAAFLIRFDRSGRFADGVTAGVLIGLAAQTKNAGLIGVVLLTLCLGWSALSQRITLRNAARALAACGMMTAPWYFRNLREAGMMIPPTAWVDQAERTLESLLIFLTLTNNFGVVGIGLVSAMIVLALAWMPRTSRIMADNDVRRAFQFIGLLTLPFFVAWWLFASYDPRFLLLFTPLLCVPVGWAGAGLVERLPHQRSVIHLVGLLVAAGLIAFNTYHSVDYKDDILRHPLMTYDEKLILTGREPGGFVPPVSP